MAIKFNDVSSKRSYRHLKFEDLKIGDIFQSKDPSDASGWCMKTDEGHDYEGSVDSNAVLLDEGILVYFPDCSDVVKLDKNLTIEYTAKDLLEWV
jgi:hypothetical protein